MLDLMDHIELESLSDAASSAVRCKVDQSALRLQAWLAFREMDTGKERGKQAYVASQCGERM